MILKRFIRSCVFCSYQNEFWVVVVLLLVADLLYCLDVSRVVSCLTCLVLLRSCLSCLKQKGTR